MGNCFCMGNCCGLCFLGEVTLISVILCIVGSFFTRLTVLFLIPYTFSYHHVVIQSGVILYQVLTLLAFLVVPFYNYFHQEQLNDIENGIFCQPFVKCLENERDQLSTSENHETLVDQNHGKNDKKCCHLELEKCFNLKRCPLLIRSLHIFGRLSLFGTGILLDILIVMVT